MMLVSPARKTIPPASPSSPSMRLTALMMPTIQATVSGAASSPVETGADERDVDDGDPEADGVGARRDDDLGGELVARPHADEVVDEAHQRR